MCLKGRDTFCLFLPCHTLVTIAAGTLSLPDVYRTEGRKLVVSWAEGF